MNLATLPQSLLACLAPIFMGACAAPATEVSVPTESMHEAWQQAQGPRSLESAVDPSPRRPARSLAPPGAPHPDLAPPDVRMAYLYEWVDADGNKHFGSWVAIPLRGFDWIMNDGSSPAASPR